MTAPKTDRPDTSPPAVTTDALLEHWQGHRRLTRKVIAAFPEDQLFTFSVGGMRTFGELAREILGMGAPMVQGAVNGQWDYQELKELTTRDALLAKWDEATPHIDALWKQIPDERFQEHIVAFGQFPGKAYDLLLYVIDNEVHHRAQGYVYLRALGVNPPAFYERT